MKPCYLSLLFIVLCGGCGSVKVHREYADLKKDTKKMTGTEVAWQRIENCIEPTQQTLLDPQVLSYNDAISLALQYNPGLQASLEELGIAKADLMQAGFYTNPRIDSIFRVPTDGPGRTNIELDATMTLSDAWQVPLRRHIAYDQLEITTMHILRMILDLTRDTKMAYMDCIYEQKIYVVVQHILENISALKDRIYDRQQFGFTTDLDTAMADIAVGHWQVKLVEHKARVKNAFVKLRHVIGATISWQPIMLSEQLPTFTQSQDMMSLQIHALENRPEMHIAQWRIKKAEDTLSLEKAKIIDDVSFGVSYKRDFEFPNKGWGPRFGLDLPFFNTNLGNRERARFQINQAEQEQRAHAQMIREEVQHAYITMQAVTEQIAYYSKDIIPASHRALEYTNTYFDRMQINMTVLLEAYQTMLMAQQELLFFELERGHALAQLERAIARRMDQWYVSDKVNFIQKGCS